MESPRDVGTKKKMLQIGKPEKLRRGISCAEKEGMPVIFWFGICILNVNIHKTDAYSLLLNAEIL